MSQPMWPSPILNSQGLGRCGLHSLQCKQHARRSTGCVWDSGRDRCSSSSSRGCSHVWNPKDSPRAPHAILAGILRQRNEPLLTTQEKIVQFLDFFYRVWLLQPSNQIRSDLIWSHDYADYSPKMSINWASNRRLARFVMQSLEETHSLWLLHI